MSPDGYFPELLDVFVLEWIAFGIAFGIKAPFLTANGPVACMNACSEFGGAFASNLLRNATNAAKPSCSTLFSSKLHDTFRVS